MFKKLLVPTDGSKLSTEAVQSTLVLASEIGAEVVALNVQPPFQPPIVAEVPAAYLYSPDEYEKVVRESARKVLDQVQAMAAEHKVTCHCVIELDPSPYEAIIRAAKAQHCDLIVMASHGRRGMAGMILGSETQKVLTHCKIPVLVHR